MSNNENFNLQPYLADQNSNCHQWLPNLFQINCKDDAKIINDQDSCSSYYYEYAVLKNSRGQQLVAKRNERERLRVRAVNESFNRLRKLIPSINCRKKRVSKVKTIRKALEYISFLQHQLNAK